MAEIRKYDPAAGNAIAQALRAAMGEPVRPNVPGEHSPRPATPQPSQTASVVNFAITTNVVSTTDDEDADQD